ncbi:MAG TPA: 50S ribosomal protein L3 N(5)-glutamine methyltransferase [Usitatibacter sp.]|nr:50S ribosomal protein L3 N(5)-glutamine methyltransferase [Usitatibacter sp.]
MTRTVRALLDYGVERFERAGLAYGHGTGNALDEAAWIILSSLGLPPSELNPHLDQPLTEARYRETKALLDARVRTRKPAAYLLHEAWLGPHKFYVDERVIVPRSFIAEMLIRGQAPVSRGAERSILDLCTGSGCLAILAALTHPEAKVDAADLSDAALEVAKRNVADYKLGRRVRLVKSDLFGALATRRYDLILSNPPYVRAASMRKLPDEFRKEPDIALASGSDGLDHTRRILAGAKEHLNPRGSLVVEIGHNRAALERAYPSFKFKWPKVAAGAGYVFVLTREQLP